MAAARRLGRPEASSMPGAHVNLGAKHRLCRPEASGMLVAHGGSPAAPSPQRTLVWPFGPAPPGRGCVRRLVASAWARGRRGGLPDPPGLPQAGSGRGTVCRLRFTFGGQGCPKRHAWWDGALHGLGRAGDPIFQKPSNGAGVRFRVPSGGAGAPAPSGRVSSRAAPELILRNQGAGPADVHKSHGCAGSADVFKK